MISQFLLDDFARGFVWGTVFARADHWRLTGWRRWLSAMAISLGWWLALGLAGHLLKSAGL